MVPAAAGTPAWDHGNKLLTCVKKKKGKKHPNGGFSTSLQLECPEAPQSSSTRSALRRVNCEHVSDRLMLFRGVSDASVGAIV